VVTVADRVGLTVRAVTGSPTPIRIHAWDGSVTGPAVGPAAVLRSRRAIRRMVYRPGELGLADAYIAGDLDVDGDLTEALEALRSVVRHRPDTPIRPGAARWLNVALAAVRLGALGPPPRRAAHPIRTTGRRHSRSRDSAVIAHHYDLPPAFYELLLDDSMAYSCAYFAEPSQSLADAQRAKLDLICRKLELHTGSTLLDIGCGWGSLACHAARHFGTTVTAVTLSAEQAAYLTRRVDVEGLSSAVTVWRADYRELTDVSGFDAVTSVEMGEHVGDREYPGFADLLCRALRPGGLALVQQMSRTGIAPDGGPFIRTWIAPDMHMKPLATTVGLLAAAGLEIRGVQALREHYTWTIDAWAANLERHWDRAVSLLGEDVCRVWRLYLAGSALAFTPGRMGVDQILAVRSG